MLTLSWSGWIALAVVDIGILYFLRVLHRRRPLLAADKVAASAVLLSINIFFLLSNLFLDRNQCGQNPTIACLINTNRGLWTFGAMCVASVTLYINARMKQLEDSKTEARRRGSASIAIEAALEELVHNLQHFSKEIDDADRFITFPATSFDDTFNLCSNDIIYYCSPNLIHHIRILQRITCHNKAMLRAIGEVEPEMKLMSIMDEIGVVRFSKTDVLSSFQQLQKDEGTAGQAGSVDNKRGLISALNRVRFDQRIITHSIHCIMAIAYYHRKAAMNIISDPSFKWLAKHLEGTGHGHYYYTKSSEVVESEAASIRRAGVILYCWIKDANIENVQIIPIRVPFRDMTHKCS